MPGVFREAWQSPDDVFATAAVLDADLLEVSHYRIALKLRCRKFVIAFVQAVNWVAQRSPEAVQQARETVMAGIETAAANFRRKGDVEKWSVYLL